MSGRVGAVWRIGAALAVAACAGASRSAAQAAGTVGVLLQLHVPDSLKRSFPIGDSIETRGTLYSDGHRVAIELTAGLGTAMPMLANLRVVFLITPGVDTVHGAVLFPPGMAGMTGGPAGYKLDFPLRQNDSTGAPGHGAPAQVDTNMAFASLNSTSMVAGIPCEEWLGISGSDTTRFCMIVAPPEVEQFRGVISAATGAVPGAALGFRDSAMLRAFGGRRMVPIRVDNAAQGMRFEVTSVSAEVPDSTHFVLPPNLIPFVNPLKPGGR